MAFISPRSPPAPVFNSVPKPPKKTLRERTIHRLAHDVAEDDAARADQAARNDQDGILNDKSRRAGREAGITIEQRNHDRHIGAADGNDREHPSTSESRTIKRKTG